MNGRERRAARLYALLLRFYPAGYRRAFGDQMLDAFRDHYRDALELGGERAPRFWFGVAGDLATSLLRERVTALNDARTGGDSPMNTVKPALVIGLALVLFAGFAGFPPGGVVPRPLVLIVLALATAAAVVWARRAARAADPPIASGERRWRHPAVYAGLFAGLCWLAINLATSLAAYNGAVYRAAQFVGPDLFALAMPVAFGVAGFVGGRRRGATRDGTLAGLLAAAIGAAIMLASLAAIMLLFWGTVRANALQDPFTVSDWRHSGDASFGRFLWRDTLSGAGIMALVSLLFGALLGTFGGALGAIPPRNGRARGAEPATSGGGAG